jgi:hypothetical protein
LAEGQLEPQLALNALSALWELQQQIYRRGKTANRIGMRGALERLLTGAAKIIDGLVEVVAVSVVMR